MSNFDVSTTEISAEKSKNKKEYLKVVLPLLALALIFGIISIPSISQAARRHRRRSYSSTPTTTTAGTTTSTGTTTTTSGSTSTTTGGTTTTATSGTGTTGTTTPVPSPSPTPTPIPVPTSAPTTTTTPAPTTTSNIPFLRNLVGYWKLNGNTNGALGKDNGKVVGNITYVPGKFGQAAHFDGKSYIEIPDQDYFSPSTFGQKTTVSFWFKPDTYNFPGVNQGYVNFLGKSDFSTGSEWEFRLDNETAYDGFSRSERMNFYAFNKTAGLGAGSAINKACPLNTWTHVVGEIDGANTKLYINGILVDQDPLSGYNINMSNTSTPLRIGTSDKEAFLQGSISNLMIYNRNLTDSEVTQLFNTDLSK